MLAEEENKLAASCGAQGQRRVVREKKLEGWSDLLLAAYRGRKGAGKTCEEIEYTHMHKLACAHMRVVRPVHGLTHNHAARQSRCCSEKKQTQTRRITSAEPRSSMLLRKAMRRSSRYTTHASHTRVIYVYTGSMCVCGCLGLRVCICTQVHARAPMRTRTHMRTHIHTCVLIPICAQVLIEAGTDVLYSPSTDGRTALHWSAFYGHRQCCDLLQNAGGNVAEFDNDGHSPQVC